MIFIRELLKTIYRKRSCLLAVGSTSLYKKTLIFKKFNVNNPSTAEHASIDLSRRLDKHGLQDRSSSGNIVLHSLEV